MQSTCIWSQVGERELRSHMPWGNWAQALQSICVTTKTQPNKQINTKKKKKLRALCLLVTQSCLALCDLMDCSLSGSSEHGIFQARILERVAINCLAAKSCQFCPTLCDPIDGSPPGSPVPGTLQARTLEWVAISFSNAWKWKVKVKLLSCVRLFETPWTAAYQAPPSMGFSRQEYWSGLPLPSQINCLNTV